MIAGKKVTGFTTKGEEEEGVLDTIKSWKRPTIEASAADSGATCEFYPSSCAHQRPCIDMQQQTSVLQGLGTLSHRRTGVS